jgi:hypothetical protein
MKYNFDCKFILDKIEKYIISVINTKPPICYSRLSNEEKIILQEKIIKNKILNKDNLINMEIINSIRSSFIKNKMIRNHHFLNKNIINITNDYTSRINILKLTEKYDISPLNLLRTIFKNKYNKDILILYENSKLLDDFDNEQLNIAITNDNFALINQDIIQNDSVLFENKIQFLLEKNKIKFRTQTDLINEQIKLYGFPKNTPDFLLDKNEELYFNNIKINWIDAKNFYGSNIDFLKKKIKKQIKKYTDVYGSGCIIFSLGFNEQLKFENCIIIDYNTIKNIL